MTARQEEAQDNRVSVVKADQDAQTAFPGRWSGFVQQFDGETGHVLDKSRVELWVGQKGRNFSRLCVRVHEHTRERMFVKGELKQYDAATGSFTAVATDNNFTWTTKYMTPRTSSLVLRHKDAGKDIVVNGIVSFPNNNRKCTLRQIFLGNKLTLESSQEVRLGTCVYMPCDPDPQFCTDPDHNKNYPDGFAFSYDT